MNLKNSDISSIIDWKPDEMGRIPLSAYVDEDIYKLELERIFYKKHWGYLGLDAEIPNVGDFKRTVIGERSVIVVRNKEGGVSAFENLCAHRRVQFCRERDGNRQEFVCPYHQWMYDLEGNLRGLPYRRGLRVDGELRGGMPADFNMSENGLTKLKVESRNGVIFGSFAHDIESFADYLGEMMLGYFDRIFNGRKLTILGYNRQRIPGNWKLMMENIKDPYHAGLLHTWFVTFGLWRADSPMSLKMDPYKRHAVMAATRSTANVEASLVSGVQSFKEDMVLKDPSQIDIVPEDWWTGPTATMMTLFPALIIQQQVNSLSTRHIQPRGPNSFDFVWTHFGFEDDDKEMTARRLKQANLFGPSGYVSADDGEVLEFSQMGFHTNPSSTSMAKMGGNDTQDGDCIATETLIRGMYKYWREVMEV